MSGDIYYFGDSVSMHGGLGNTGIVKNQAAPAASEASPALEAAIQQLVELVRELRNEVPPASAQSIDDCLPDITTAPGTQPQQRHRALMAVAGIAATVGAVGQPVVEAVNSVLGLLGG
ncbi:hypothetical protein RI578_17115 [Streptomyces sp. BB1-1-1]|uniref:hypothetical protein n=1 Tax=Streptomyces sp. BB1-1-1 TaxID=3074430 RepID=UPI00287745EE|nr:hypothetical protein [Streptomyces sp. BB1-1-1]WND35909.1 hypothetical protein RI578_17115 [Streptomyces sp. BB1-1-1]